jgi:eukaryotic-like serine/threonine-protein kinase
MQTSMMPIVTMPDRPAVGRSDREPLGQLGRWELLSLEGEGTLARIYRARPVELGGRQAAAYAVKVLQERWHGDDRAVALLAREAELGRAVAHPHLISVLSARLTRPPYYLVMPWLDGQTLRRALDEGGRFDLPVVLWIARQTAEALGALAAAGWRHGDLKPANLHISADGHVTVLDLGLARRLGESDSVLDRCVTGTCQYLAPEAITSTLAADVRSDVYSLGAVMFEMLMGQVPFSGESLEAIVSQHRRMPPPELRRLVPSLPTGVVRLVREMLAKEPFRRPQTPEELIDRLVGLEIQTFGQRGL